jgi:hypothetical protein
MSAFRRTAKLPVILRNRHGCLRLRIVFRHVLADTSLSLESVRFSFPDRLRRFEMARARPGPATSDECPPPKGGESLPRPLYRNW